MDTPFYFDYKFKEEFIMNINIMGIYKIINIKNNKIYIGSSADIHKRWCQHKTSLNKNKHCNKHLQAAWNKYGEESFKFEIVELVDDEEVLFSAEQKWINKTKCYDGNYGYNISIDASRPNIGDKLNHLDVNLVYRNKLDDLINMKLSRNEKLVYYVLREFVQHPSNCVMINNNIPTFKELEPLVSLTERSIRDCLKTLELKGLIKLVQSSHKKAIYINPEYYSTGKEISNETLQLFGLLEIDEEKINHYLNE
jgi:group I intron endonuclease